MLAYLDPATGGMILQAAAGAVAATVVGVKFYWGKVKRVLRIERSDSPENQQQP
jgi:hypothetical protein